MDIGEYGTPATWQQEMVQHDFNSMDGTVQDLVAFCECMEQMEEQNKNAMEVAKKPKAKETYTIPKKNGKHSRQWWKLSKENMHNTSQCTIIQSMK